MIKEVPFDINDIYHDLKERDIIYSDNEIYIMPEGTSNDKDIINEYTPDISKILKLHKVNNIIVKKTSYEYLALRDDSIILPLIVGIPFSILSSFIYDWIKKSFNDQSIIKLKFTKRKKNNQYVKIEIEGNKEEIKNILESLKDF